MTARQQAIERKLERFIIEELLEDGPVDGDPLEADAVDSLGLEQLVEYIEGEFGVRLGDEEMSRENFESMPALAALIAAKR